jgi:CRP/FNR family transcriptional regulator
MIRPMQTPNLLPREQVIYVRTADAGRRAETRCSTCAIKDKCLPAGVSETDVGRLDGLAFARRRIKEGEELFSAGQQFSFVYAVRSGTLKTTLATVDGREQVSGYIMAGELLGLDGLASGFHSTSAIALEDAEVCAIPYAQLAQLGTESPRMYLAISRLLSGEIVRDRRLMVLLGSMNAEERLAAFLVDVSDRMKARGYSASEFHLRMSRADIGSYLGMTLETVSRAFSSFQRQRMIDVDKKHVRILDLDAMRAMSGETVHH